MGLSEKPGEREIKGCYHELPEGKTLHPTHPNQAPFKALERFLDIDTINDTREAVREIKGHAVKKLEILDQLHGDLVRQARSIVENTREDLRLHNVRMYSKKVRAKIYYLYTRSGGEDFFSILTPGEYEQADPEARFLGAYRLNEDSSWTKVEKAE
jgi:hypothetical protein